MNLDALLIVAGMIFAMSVAGLVGLIALSRRDDRAVREEMQILR